MKYILILVPLIVLSISSASAASWTGSVKTDIWYLVPDKGEQQRELHL